MAPEDTRVGYEVGRRKHVRYTAPADTFVDVELPSGSGTQARILDASPFGGACLVFAVDPKVEIGDMVRVSYGSAPALGEIRHACEVGDEHRVGVLWTNVYGDLCSRP